MNSDVGELLKKRREEKKLSLEDVQKATKIQQYVLRYLEDGSAEERLGSVYAKSFLKLYAKFLGVDLNLLLDRQMPVSPEFSPAEPKPKSEYKLLKDSVLNRLSFKIPKVNFASNQLAKKIGIALIIVVLLAWFIPKKKNIEKLPSKKPPVETSKSAGPVAKKVPAKKKEVPEQLLLSIRAVEDSWLQVKCGSRVVFQRTLTKGSAEKWQAKDKIELRVGNAQGLLIELNGQSIGRLGRRGEVVRVAMTKDGVNIGK